MTISSCSIVIDRGNLGDPTLLQRIWERCSYQQHLVLACTCTHIVARRWWFQSLQQIKSGATAYWNCLRVCVIRQNLAQTLPLLLNLHWKRRLFGMLIGQKCFPETPPALRLQISRSKRSPWWVWVKDASNKCCKTQSCNNLQVLPVCMQSRSGKLRWFHWSPKQHIPAVAGMQSASMERGLPGNSSNILWAWSTNTCLQVWRVQGGKLVWTRQTKGLVSLLSKRRSTVFWLHKKVAK